MFRLEFETVNAAFIDGDPREEIAQILESAAQRVREGRNDLPIRDVNGNTIGRWQWFEEDGE